MKRFLFILMAWAGLGAFLGMANDTQAAEQRVALVIGNGAYKSTPLTNPTHDAEDMAAALTDLGFTVIKEINANRARMRDAVRRFGDQIKRGGVGLFFYAGHGVQIDGENYLVPVDADVARKFDVEDQCLRASYVLGAMEEAANRLNIIILDACRDNPFRGFRSSNAGLAQMNAPTGSILAYSTAPGATASDGSGRNGLYTSKLLKHVKTPGLSLLDLFMTVRKEVKLASQDKQVPWETQSLTDQFYLVTGSASAAPSSLTSPPTAPAAPAAPTVPSVDLGDIQGEAKSRQGWQDWQAAMNRAWTDAENLDKDPSLPPSKKVEAWQRVLGAYADRNPYNQEDEVLRTKGRDRLAYWRSQPESKPTKASSASLPPSGPVASPGTQTPGRLGVEVQKVTPELAGAFGANVNQGAYVVKALADSPAQQAGLQPGDIIVALNGRRLASSDELPGLIAAAGAGSQVKLTLFRSGQEKSVSVGLGAMPVEYQHINRGNDYLKQQNYAQAKSEFQAALDTAPREAVAFAGRAVASQYLGDLDAALADYTQAINLASNPTIRADAYFRRAYVWYKKGNLDQALADSDQAVAQNPKIALAFFNRSIYWGEKGNQAQALADAREALRLEPANQELQKRVTALEGGPARREGALAGEVKKTKKAGNLVGPPPQGCFIDGVGGE